MNSKNIIPRLVLSLSASFSLLIALLWISLSMLEGDLSERIAKHLEADLHVTWFSAIDTEEIVTDTEALTSYMDEFSDRSKEIKLDIHNPFQIIIPGNIIITQLDNVVKEQSNECKFIIKSACNKTNFFIKGTKRPAKYSYRYQLNRFILIPLSLILLSLSTIFTMRRIPF